MLAVPIRRPLFDAPVTADRLDRPTPPAGRGVDDSFVRSSASPRLVLDREVRPLERGDSTPPYTRLTAGALLAQDQLRLAARERGTFTAAAPAATEGPSLDQVLAGEVVLHGDVVGGAASQGQGVRDAQQQLRDAGYDVPDTGVYDAATVAAVRAYQESRGLTVNGHVNRETAAALREGRAAIEAEGTEEASAVREVDVPATRGMTEEEKYDYYQQRLADAGVEVDEGAGEKNVVCLRRKSDPDARGGKGEYDDVMVVIWVDEDGTKHVRELPGTTEPSGRYDGDVGDDVNGDGLKDQGRLPAGYHDTFQIEDHPRLGAVLRPDHDADVERDPQHDGTYDEESSALRSVLFHEGGRNATGSAGCMTMPPDVFADFMALMAEDPDGSISVTVLDMPE